MIDEDGALVLLDPEDPHCFLCGEHLPEGTFGPVAVTMTQRATGLKLVVVLCAACALESDNVHRAMLRRAGVSGGES